MRPVNLLPKDSPGNRRTLPPVPVVAAGATPVLAAALVLFGWSVEHGKVRNRTAELDAARAEVRTLTPSTGAAAASQLAALRDARTAAAEGVLHERVAWDGVLDQIARVLPGDVWLSQLTLESATPLSSSSTASAAPGLQITGSARSQAAVAHVLARLAVVPALTKVALVSTTTSTVGKTDVIQFQVTATVGGAS
jgi:Tfp pilus assembly protein PilN